MKITWIGVFSFSGLQTASVQIKTEWWKWTVDGLKMWTIFFSADGFCGHEFILMSEFFSLSILVFVKGGYKTEQTWSDNPARWLARFWEEHHLDILTRTGQAKKSHTIKKFLNEVNWPWISGNEKKVIWLKGGLIISPDTNIRKNIICALKIKVYFDEK